MNSDKILERLEQDVQRATKKTPEELRKVAISKCKHRIWVESALITREEINTEVDKILNQ